MDPGTLSAFLESWGYLALLVLLLLTGFGSPVPEDLLLLTGGYLVFAGVFNWRLALVTSVAGVVASDFILYSAGRQIRLHSGRWLNSPFLPPARLERATRWFLRRGHVLVLLARLIPGTRLIVFITAGIHAVPVSSFLRYDILGAVLWVPAMLAVGHAIGSHVGNLRTVLNWFTRAGTVVVVFAGVLVLIRVWWGREQSKL